MKDGATIYFAAATPDATYVWLAVKDSSETLLLVELCIETPMLLGSKAITRGFTGILARVSSCMCSIFGTTKAGNSGNITGGAFLSGHERIKRTGLGESGGSGNAHADTFGNSYDGTAANCSASISAISYAATWNKVKKN